MNVPKEIPTTSQMICLLVSHTMELYFVLCASPELGHCLRKPGSQLTDGQSTKHSFRSLSASVAARAAALRSRIELRRYASRAFADKSLRHSDRLRVRAWAPSVLPRGPLREGTVHERRLLPCARV